MSETNNFETITVDDFCKLMNIGRSTFYYLMKRNKAPKFIKINRKIAILKSDLTEWINSNKV